MKKEFKPAYRDGKRSGKDNIKLLNKIYEIDNISALLLLS